VVSHSAFKARREISKSGDLENANNVFIGMGADTTKYTVQKSIAIGCNAVVKNDNQAVFGGTGADGVILGFGGTTAPADADIATGFAFLYFDLTPGETCLAIKGKDTGGSVWNQRLGFDRGASFYIGGGGTHVNIDTDQVTACDNIAIGAISYDQGVPATKPALALITTGEANVAIGSSALSALTTGNGNTAIGESPMLALQTGNNNIGLGGYTLGSLNGGQYNIAHRLQRHGPAGQRKRQHRHGPRLRLR
jgi:hypothetical protein